ncbi:MAG: GTPase HflX [Mariprofundaceae bacterium]|nr:GTPase HflX [Mariprofundaceae bacterium]
MSGSWEVPQDRDAVISIHPELASLKRGPHVWHARAEEFDQLVMASNCDLHDSICLPVRRPIAATLFGRGQIENIRDSVVGQDAVVVFVDHPLSPVQQRNLEEAWDSKVVDRTGLILEIFAARAQTKEGSLQVELASLNYQISRLVRSWTHLERQRGGFGFLGGPGERQIELDRRQIRNRILKLEKELSKVRRMRSTQRAGRKRKNIPTVALVGYTNAGKSTLFNRLTGSDVYAASQLFATLDPTLRKVELADGHSLMLSDTVGFVQELPHELVDAFRATLEEVVEADLIIHVRDAADSEVRQQGKVVDATLREIGLEGDIMPPVIEVWNKTDLASQVKSRLTPEINGSRVALSALTGAGVSELMAVLHDWLEAQMVETSLTLDAADGKGLAFCYEHGTVLGSSFPDDETVIVRLLLSASDLGRFEISNGISRLKGG